MTQDQLIGGEILHLISDGFAFLTLLRHNLVCHHNALNDFLLKQDPILVDKEMLYGSNFEI